MSPNIGRGVYAPRSPVLGRRLAATSASAGVPARGSSISVGRRAREPRSAVRISRISVALDHLVVEQPLGDHVEQVAVVDEQLLGAAVGLLGDRLHLLVAGLAQRLGDR